METGSKMSLSYWYENTLNNYIFYLIKEEENRGLGNKKSFVSTY